MTRAAIVDYDDYNTFSKLPPLRLRMTTCVSTANCDAGDQNVDGAIGLPATSTSETSSLRKVPITESDARQHGIYLFYIITKSLFNFKIFQHNAKVGLVLRLCPAFARKNSHLT